MCVCDRSGNIQKENVALHPHTDESGFVGLALVGNKIIYLTSKPNVIPGSSSMRPSRACQSAIACEEALAK